VTKKPSLSETHPELAAHAIGWDPTTVSRGSDKKLRWQCIAKHCWEATVSSRVAGSGCPVCSGHQVLAGFNDVGTTHPQIARQAFGWDPTTIGRGSHKKLEWQCDHGHQWAAELKSRTLIGAGCPYCDGKKPIIGENDLQTKFPDIALEAFGWDPSTVNCGSHKKKKWKCKLGHITSVAIRRRVEGVGCPVCSNDQVLAGYNDLSTKHPEIAKDAFGWDPTFVLAGSHKRVLWRCKDGHDWSTSVSGRVSIKSGCPYCSGRNPISGKTDLLTTHPELASQLVDTDPRTIKSGTNKRCKWRCLEGHVWETTPASRSSGTGCPVCSGHQVLTGFNDLATTHTEIAQQACGWDPKTISYGNAQKMLWECESGHQWKAQPYSRTTNRTGCPVCSGHQVLTGFNDLATTHPELASEAVGWNPKTISYGSSKKLRWQCKEGHEWSTKVSARTYMSSGCPSCATYGFDPNLEGWLYFLEHDRWDLFQIGISNYPDRRIDRHKKSGWSAITVRGPMNGDLAQNLETTILHAIEKRGAQLAHKTDIKQFDGWSEAWTKASLPVTSIKQLLDWVYEDEAK